MKKWSEFLEGRCWPGYKPKPGKKAYSPGSCVKEDLRQWFDPDHPKGGWKRINSKGEAIGPCAREPGEAKPKCMSNEKRASLSKKERASAVSAKRRHDPNPERKGQPINVSNFGKGKISENMENLDEKNVPTSPEKWAQAKSQAKAKFDVYPSAYANGWASKKYKEMGGGWKSVSEAKEESEYDYEGDMARGQLQSIINNAQRVHDMLKDKDNLPEWVQSKITLAEDYISTVANYMMSELDEAMSGGYYTSFHKETGKIGYIGNKKGMVNHVKSNSDHIRGFTGPNTKVGDIFGGYPKKTVKEEVMQEGIKDEPHEIVHKETGKTVSTHKNYKDAYSAYQNLVKASDHAIGHIPKKTNEAVSHDPWKDKTFGPTKVIQQKYKVKTDTKTYNVKAETEAHAHKLVSNHAPGSKIVSIEHKGRIMEEVEPIEELSKDTLKRYIPTAAADLSKKGISAGIDAKSGKSGATKEYGDHFEKRYRGIIKATRKLAKEEAEQIDELSRETLHQYWIKAVPWSVTHKMIASAARKDAAAITDPNDHYGAHDLRMKARGHSMIGKKRDAGIKKANDRLKKDSEKNYYKDHWKANRGYYGPEQPLQKEEVSKTSDATTSAEIGTPAQLSLKVTPKKLETPVYESRQLQIVREALADAKKKDAAKKKEKKVNPGGDDKFQAEPELTSSITKNT